MAVTAGAIRAGKGFVELFADDSKLVKGLRAAQKRLQAWGASVSRLGTRLITLGGAALAPLALTVKAASDMEETMNKFNVVFGENAAGMKAWGDEFAGQVGRSKKQVADFLANTQDLFVPLGFDPTAAEEMSKQVSALAIDLASFNNKLDADVIRDLHAALTGSGEVMKKYGVIVSEAAVKQEMLNQGLDPRIANDQQKVMARLSIILKGTTAAHGDAIRSAGSLANQMTRMRAALDNAAVSIGETLIPVITPLGQQLAGAVEAAGKYIAANRGLVLSVFQGGAALVGFGVALKVLGPLLSLVAAGIGLTITAVTALAGAVGFLLTPLGLITGAMVGGLAAFFAWSEGGQQAVQNVSQAFAPLGDQLSQTFRLVIRAVKAGKLRESFEFLAKVVGIIWKNLMESIEIAFREMLAAVVGGIIDMLLTLPHRLGELVPMKPLYQLQNKLLFLGDEGQREAARRGLQRQGREAEFADAVRDFGKLVERAEAEQAAAVAQEPRPFEIPKFDLPNMEDLLAARVPGLSRSGATSGTFNPFAIPQGRAEKRLDEIAATNKEQKDIQKKMLAALNNLPDPLVVQ